MDPNRSEHDPTVGDTGPEGSSGREAPASPEDGEERSVGPEHCSTSVNGLTGISGDRVKAPQTVGDPEARIRELERSNRGMALLLEILNFVQGAVDLETTLRIILACVTSGYSIGFNRAFLFLLGEDGRSLRGVLAVGPRDPQEAHEIWKDIEEKASSLEDIVAASRMGGRAGDVELTRLVREIRIEIGGGTSVLEGCIARAEAKVVADPGSLGEQEILRRLGSRTFVFAPILGAGRPIGVIIADNLITGEIPSDEQVGLLKALAYQVGQIIASATHREDIERRLQELSTLTEVSKGILSTTDLESDLSLIARISAQVLNARGAVLRLVDDETGQLQIKATFGITIGEMGEPANEGAQSLAEEVAKDGRPRLVKDTSQYVQSDPALARRKNLICVPLAKGGRVIGTLTVFDRATSESLGHEAFGENDLRFLAVLAGQAAIAIANAQLIDGLKKSQERIRELHRHLLRSERLAALGELSSQVAHEIRNPLTAIGGFARSVQRRLSGGDANRKAIDTIVKETERLERILTEQLCFARLSPPELKPGSINGVIEDVLDLFREKLDAKRAVLTCELDPGLPQVMIDSDKMKQVFINLLQNAVDNIDENGNIRIGSYPGENVLEVRISNDGPAIEEPMLNRLFVPFATTKASGSGLGLAVTYEIVYEHGGAIDVKSGEGETVFLVTLPIRAEGERRQGPVDRRSMLRDRRRAGRNP
jgi:signal transduction histidine kinase